MDTNVEHKKTQFTRETRGEMEESLHAWLRAASADVFGAEDVPHTAEDIKTQVYRLSRFIFDLETDCPIDDVIEEIAAYMDHDISDDLRSSTIFLIEACLICAVSSESIDRGRFVQGIMCMDQSVQQHIMTAIKNNLQHYFSTEDDDNVDEQEEEFAVTEDTIIEEMNEKLSSSSPDIVVATKSVDGPAVAAVNMTYNAMHPSVTVCSSCEEREKGLLKAHESLEIATRREKDNEAKFHAEIAAQTNKLIDAEIIIIEKEDKLSEQAALLEDTVSKLHECEDKVRESVRVLAQFQTVQDEVDVLRPRAERADAAEQQLDKLRSRLDDLKGVRQQLKDESAAHAETHTKLLAAEQELDSLRRAKAQVEDYRTQCAESSIRIDELSLRLRQRDELIGRLEGDLSFVRGDHQGQREQSEQLSAELRAAEEQLREGNVRGAGGIGEAMCELNPALMQELQKLRAENDDLLRKIDASSMDALDGLEKHVADQRCISASLQEKWMGTKDALATAQSNIILLNSKLAQLSMDYVALQQRTAEAATMSDNDRLTAHLAHGAKCHHMRAVSDARQALVACGHAVVVEGMRGEWRACEDDLALQLQALSAMTAERDGLTVDLAAMTEALAQEVSGRQADREASTAADVRRVEEHRQELVRVEENQQERMRLLEEQHEGALQAEAERGRDTAAELDGERIKRRRVERGKKFFESETHRLKTQLTVTASGGSTGQDIEEALTEIKAMQQQLDSAHMEVQLLRSQGTYEDSSGRQLTVNDAAALAAAAASGGGVGIKGSALRPPRGKAGERGEGVGTRGAASSSSSGTGSAGGICAGTGGGTYGGYLEQVEVSDKRVDQLMRERRELIAKNLEENKERMELSQKLMLCEKDCTSLRGKVTKLTLEKERMERRMANICEVSNALTTNKRTRSQMAAENNENEM